MFTADKYQQVRFSYTYWDLESCCWVICHGEISLWPSFCDLLSSVEYQIIISLQIGFFPNERAFSLRYQTAGMLETVLRQGVLGEDDIGEELPK